MNDAEAEEAALEVLCSMDCHPDICKLGLCWHCWHRDEAGGRPDEVRQLLRQAHAFSAASAPGHRARLVERAWQPLALLADAAKDAAEKLKDSLADSRRPLVAVLGGVGTSAIAAARAGADVVWLEKNQILADVAKSTLARNGVSPNQVSLIQDLSDDNLTRLRAADVVVLEGLEADGILGCGALESLHKIAEPVCGDDTRKPAILPSTLEFRAALSESRLSTAAGLKFDLKPFANVYGGLHPLPRSVPTHACVVRPAALSEEAEVCLLDLAEGASASSSSSFSGTKQLKFQVTRRGRVDAVTVKCSSSTLRSSQSESASKHWVESLYAFAAPFEVAEGDVISVTCSWNVNRLWFSVEGITPCAPPLAKIHLLDWYSEMMNDLPRNEAYAAAIASAVARCRSKNGNKPCRVVDIGCGAGLLSLLALQAGAEEVVGIEITSHLARCAANVRLANAEHTKEDSKSSKDNVLHSDVRSVVREGDECFDIALTELLDSSGFGERLVPILRHTKSHLLQQGGEIIPRAIRVLAALVDVHLPRLAGVDLACLEPFWLPARASQGEWMAVDLDDVRSSWKLVSEPVEVFSVDFTGDQQSIARALCEHDVSFSLKKDAGQLGACNTIVWWFDADIGEGAPSLCNAPELLRPDGAGATHWAQAIACVGPWPQDKLAEGTAVRMTVRTDGTTFRWTPLGLETSSKSEGYQNEASLLPLPQNDPPCVDSAILDKWREQASEPIETMRNLRNGLDNFGDIARLQALQAATLHMAAQPGLFGLEATSEALAPLLKDFYV